MERWGDGEMGRWGVGEIEENLRLHLYPSPSSLILRIVDLIKPNSFVGFV
jgi:hypothetical protein